MLLETREAIALIPAIAGGILGAIFKGHRGQFATVVAMHRFRLVWCH
jgi:hypothetical protein